MSRVQLALDVTDLEASVAWGPGPKGALNHLGIDDPADARPATASLPILRGGGSSACCAPAGA